VVSSKVLIRRGQRASQAGRFDQAERAFRAATASDPNSGEAAANLGISLANLGRLSEARQSLEQALRMDDSIAAAHLGLAVVHDRQGRDDAAIAEYEATLTKDAANVPARIYLADALMRRGRASEAAARYLEVKQAKAVEPALIDYYLAMALVKAGRRAAARDALEEALAGQPESKAIGNALARLLATAPERGVRDSSRALGLSRALFRSTRAPDVLQTHAMALAASGRFEEAVEMQRNAISAAQSTGASRSERFLAENLARYQRHLPAQQGWSDDDPVFSPRSPAAARRD
jgi:tetratricopeptide (TPR) repeat protein